MIPLDGLDTSWLYFGAFDADGDPSNNLTPQTDNDPYQGTDRRYEINFDAEGRQWSFRTWQSEESGSVVIDPDSNAFGIIQGDTSWLIIPGDEFPISDPRVRVAIVGYDGNPISGITGFDVNGELPTDPLVGLPSTIESWLSSESVRSAQGSITMKEVTVFERLEPSNSE